MPANKGDVGRHATAAYLLPRLVPDCSVALTCDNCEMRPIPRPWGEAPTDAGFSQERDGFLGDHYLVLSL